MSHKSLFVLNVHPDVTEDMLKKKFSVSGNVLSAYKKKKGSNYYAYINFEKHEEGRLI